MTKRSKFLRINLYVLFVLAATITILDATKITIDSVWNSETSVLSDNWTLEIDNQLIEDNFSIPSVLALDNLKGKTITQSRVLSDGGPSSNNLMFRTSQKTAEVYIGGNLIYQYDANLDMRRTQVPGYINHFVWLPEDYEGQLLEIVTVSYSERTSGTFYPVYLGSRVSHIVELLKYDGISLIFGLFILLMAVLVFLLAITLLRSLAIRKSALAFAGIELCAGLWIVSNSMSSQLLIHNQMFQLIAGVFALYMLPVFITMYVSSMYHLPEIRIFNRIVLIFPLVFIISSFTQYFNIARYQAFFTPSAIALLIYLVAIVLICVRSYRCGNRAVKQFLMAILWLLIAVLGELTLLLLPRQTLLNALFLNLGILAFGIILLRQVLYQVMVFVRQRGKEEYLLSLAHSDGLTGVANRRAFEERMEQLRFQGFQGPIGLMIFDVNNLKQLNDEKGHLAGDELLRSIAKTLATGFDTIGTVYRIGGDEFAMICAPCDCARYEAARDMLFDTHQELIDGSSSVSIAFGEVLWTIKEQFSSIDDLFSLADERMYTHKTRMKQGVIR